MTASEVLRKARALMKSAPHVTAFDVLQSVHIACPEMFEEAGEELRRQCGTAVTTWFARAQRTLAEVLSLFDRAIAAAEARGE